MERRTPLARKTRLRPIRKTPRRRPEGYQDDPGYRAWVRSLGVCFVQIWREKEWLRVTMIEDEQKRKDEGADLALEIMVGTYRCSHVIEADHMADWDRGLGQKCSPCDCAPMCSVHHRWREDMRGLFKGWTRERMRSFCEAAIAWTRKMRHQHEHPEESLP